MINRSDALLKSMGSIQGVYGVVTGWLWGGEEVVEAGFIGLYHYGDF